MSAYSNRVIADGASYYWRLGESSGLTAVAAVGGANGTISGGVTLGQAGAIADGSTAMAFNGTTGQIVTTAVALASSVSIEIWVRFTAGVTEHTIWSYRPTGAAGQFVLSMTATGAPYAFIHPGSDVTSQRTIKDGQWHHLVLVLTPTVGTMYIDGVQSQQNAIAYTLPAAVTSAIGQDPLGGPLWNGSLDDVAIYPRALTAAEVAAHYASGRTTEVGAQGPYADRVVADGASNYWRLNESSGTTAVDIVSAKDGTISGGVTLSQPSPLSDGTSAMLFNGTTGKVLTGPIALPVAWTLETWMKPSGAQTFPNGLYFTASAIPGDRDNFLFYLNNGQPGLELRGVNGQTGHNYTGPSLLNGLWHQVVWVFSGTVVQIYVDGVLAPINIPATLQLVGAAAQPYEIGAGTVYPGYFNGALDEVAIYPRALSASEIAAHYAVSTVPVPRDLNTGLYTYLLGVFGLSAGTSYADRVRADGATNHWRLGETSGTTAVDAIGGANGTISGGVTLNQPSALADGDAAMTFNGTTGQVALPAKALPAQFSVAAWIRRGLAPGVPQGSIWSNYVAGQAGALQLAVNSPNGQVQGYLETQTPTPFAIGTRRVDDGVWHHVVFTHDATSARIYVDGQLDSTTAMTHTATAPATASVIGAVAPGGAQSWNGDIDDVSIYPRALTANEIAAHYSLGRSGLSGGNDLTTLITRYLATLTGDMTARWKQMEKNAGF